MKIISILILIFALLSVSYAVKCSKYVNPLTCAGYEPPCFWDGKRCREILPKLDTCGKLMQVEDCALAKEHGCQWINEECQLNKFHCSSIKNDFDCTIENCYWDQSTKTCKAHDI